MGPQAALTFLIDPSRCLVLSLLTIKKKNYNLEQRHSGLECVL